MPEADRAVASLLTAEPEYRPDATQASPRILALFSQVRRRIGPGLVKRAYQQGRAAMERKDRDEAIAQFEGMLRLANDADVRGDAMVGELRDLGAGFLELSRALPGKQPAAARQLLTRESFGAVILDLELPDGSGWDLLPDISNLQPKARLIILTGQDTTPADANKVDSILLKSRVTPGQLLSAIHARLET